MTCAILTFAHKVFVTFSPITPPLPPANLPPKYFLAKLYISCTAVIFAQTSNFGPSGNGFLEVCVEISDLFQEFVELMIKREAEKETQEDLKQVFRVFDKVIMVSINSNLDLFL